MVGIQGKGSLGMDQTLLGIVVGSDPMGAIRREEREKSVKAPEVRELVVTGGEREKELDTKKMNDSEWVRVCVCVWKVGE